MSDIEFYLLPEACQPLANKFYRACRSPVRTSNVGQIWVARQDEIIGALCLTAVAEGTWLTGLLVAPEVRSQGVAKKLIGQALANSSGPVWLFCHPDLMPFYQRSGFAPAQALPRVLGERLMRYSRSKSLEAMVYQSSKQPAPPISAVAQ
jgi:GNAT superfamily N-acetyltransferase